MSPGLSGLAVLAFVQYLKRKGLLVLILVSGHQDLGVLRMMDLLYALPILGVERCVKDELETTSHPSWVCRWKEHAQKGSVVFGTLVDKVMWMSELTMPNHQGSRPEDERSREAVAFVGILCLHQQ